MREVEGEGRKARTDRRGWQVQTGPRATTSAVRENRLNMSESEQRARSFPLQLSPTERAARCRAQQLGSRFLRLDSTPGSAGRQLGNRSRPLSPAMSQLAPASARVLELLQARCQHLLDTNAAGGIGYTLRDESQMRITRLEASGVTIDPQDEEDTIPSKGARCTVEVEMVTLPSRSPAVADPGPARK